MIKKNKLYIFIFFILIFCTFIVFNDVPCIFKKITNIPCPGCGMTRAFKELLKFNISKAIYYNILCIPLFIFIIYICLLLIKDFITHDNFFLKKIKDIFTKYWILIIILLIISEILNIIHNI